MTTTPQPPAPIPGIDEQLAGRCEDSGEHLAGLIAKGMLDTVGRPDKLPELLWPDVDPDIVRTIWELALAVGYRAGKTAGQPRWDTDGFNRLRAALIEAGYESMGRLATRTANLHRPLPLCDPPASDLTPWHPADLDADAVRGEHW